MEEMGRRKASFENMSSDAGPRVRLEFTIPTRSLIGFRSEFMTMTSEQESCIAFFLTIALVFKNFMVEARSTSINGYR